MRVFTAADRMRETGALDEDASEPCRATDRAIALVRDDATRRAIEALRDEVRDHPPTPSRAGCAAPSAHSPTPPYRPCPGAGFVRFRNVPGRGIDEPVGGTD